MQKRKGGRKNYKKNHRNTYLSIFYMSVCLYWEDDELKLQKTYLGAVSVKVKKCEGKKEQEKKEEGRKNVTQPRRLPA